MPKKSKRALGHNWVNTNPKTQERINKSQYNLLGGESNPDLFTKTYADGIPRYFKRLKVAP